jgi:phenylpropionate dioxygenase-like ring-hydroxylating dioxygenase large terminal subunit
VCEEAGGHRAEFVCPYHGWTYRTDGSLRFVPLAHGYGPVVERKKSELGLVNVPRVESYRGFLFASLAADGPVLSEFLGPMTRSFDDMVDRAPDGEVEVAGGVFKHAYNGNWKLVLENHLDGLHPNYVHASSVEAAREAPDPGQPEKYADIATRQMRQNGAPETVWESIGIWTTDFGHGYLGDYHSDSRLVAGMDNPAFAEYRARLERKLGGERAAKVLSVMRWNSIIYPNCSFMGQFRQLRIVHPLAVDRTVVYTYSFRMKGAPEQMYRDTIAFANVVNGTASWVLTDDLEVYERVQRGLSAQASDWVNVGRGLGGDTDGGDAMRRGATGTSEIHIRSQFSAWLRYMTVE